MDARVTTRPTAADAAPILIVCGTRPEIIKLAPLYHMLKQQGMLFPAGRAGFHIDPARLPSDFIQGFEQRHCPSLDCRRCGYCGRIASDAVTIDPMFRSEQLERLKTIKQSLANGSLWGV